MSDDLLTIRVDLKGKVKERFLLIREFHGIEAYAELIRVMINAEYRRVKRIEQIEKEKVPMAEE